MKRKEKINLDDDIIPKNYYFSKEYTNNYSPSFLFSYWINC